jgi:hypothetical protein
MITDQSGLADGPLHGPDDRVGQKPAAMGHHLWMRAGQFGRNQKGDPGPATPGQMSQRQTIH